MRVGSELGYQISRTHGCPIPFQPETHPLFSHLIFTHGIWPEIVPAIMIAVASLAHRPCFPPEQAVFMSLRSLLSGFLAEGCEKTIDADGVLQATV